MSIHSADVLQVKAHFDVKTVIARKDRAYGRVIPITATTDMVKMAQTIVNVMAEEAAGVDQVEAGLGLILYLFSADSAGTVRTYLQEFRMRLTTQQTIERSVSIDPLPELRHYASYVNCFAGVVSHTYRTAVMGKGELTALAELCQIANNFAFLVQDLENDNVNQALLNMAVPLRRINKYGVNQEHGPMNDAMNILMHNLTPAGPEDQRVPRMAAQRDVWFEKIKVATNLATITECFGMGVWIPLLRSKWRTM